MTSCTGRIAGLAALAWGLAGIPSPAVATEPAAGRCPITDAYSAVERTAAATAGAPPVEQLRAFKDRVIARYPALYTTAVLGLKDDAVRDRLIVESLTAARAAGDRTVLLQRLREEIRRTERAFHDFGDFRCDFPIYFTDSLGQLDGAGRFVAGRPALVFGIGVLEREQSEISLPVLVSHEFFHRYHSQAAGFSDDLAERQPLWRSLWAEGLATYVSRLVTPGATAGAALMLPRDLEQKAAPMERQLALDFVAHMDETDTAIYTTYFTYGNAEVTARGMPWRSGYYIGYRVAQGLAGKHSLRELVHLSGQPLHDEIKTQLRAMASADQRAAAPVRWQRPRISDLAHATRTDG